MFSLRYFSFERILTFWLVVLNFESEILFPLQFSPEDDPDRESLQKAIKILRNVAIAINEFKRRKDLGMCFRLITNIHSWFRKEINYILYSLFLSSFVVYLMAYE